MPVDASDVGAFRAPTWTPLVHRSTSATHTFALGLEVRYWRHWTPGHGACSDWRVSVTAWPAGTCSQTHDIERSARAPDFQLWVTSRLYQTAHSAWFTFDFGRG